MDIIKKAIQLIKEGRWLEGIIGILMFIGMIYFIHWWHTGRWESKGICSTCKGLGTVGRRNSLVETCPQCRGTGKPDGPN